MKQVVLLICHFVATACHAENWLDHLASVHSSQLIITIMFSVTSSYNRHPHT